MLIIPSARVSIGPRDACFERAFCVRESASLLLQENAKLKKLVAERDLEIEVMKEVAANKW